MRITGNHLRQIIREELNRTLLEGDDEDYYRATPEDISDGVKKIIRYFRSEDEKRRLLDRLDNVERNIEGVSGWLHVSELEDFNVREDAGMIARDVVGNEFVIAIDDLRAAIAELRGVIKAEVGMSPVEAVIEQFKEEGPRSWDRVSNDFYAMGNPRDMSKNTVSLRRMYPRLKIDDFREILRTLDAHFEELRSAAATKHSTR